MSVEGGCLCGGVRFAIERAVGPFELCHCTRCRKASGSAFVAGVGVDVRDYRLLSGAELIGRCPWFAITDGLPALTKRDVIDLRRR